LGTVIGWWETKNASSRYRRTEPLATADFGVVGDGVGVVAGVFGGVAFPVAAAATDGAATSASVAPASATDRNNPLDMRRK
jgi:hypothetical protein